MNERGIERNKWKLAKYGEIKLWGLNYNILVVDSNSKMNIKDVMGSIGCN